jgi:hypothetical protein
LLWFGAIIFLILLGLTVAFAVYQWLFGSRASFHVRRTSQEFRRDDGEISVIETEYHEVTKKDSPPDSPAQSG